MQRVTKDEDKIKVQRAFFETMLALLFHERRQIRKESASNFSMISVLFHDKEYEDFKKRLPGLKFSLEEGRDFRFGPGPQGVGVWLPCKKLNIIEEYAEPVPVTVPLLGTGPVVDVAPPEDHASTQLDLPLRLGDERQTGNNPVVE